MPDRVVPVMCGMPIFLSRTIVTSVRGLIVLSTWSEATPNDESLKKFVSWSFVRVL